MHWNYIKCSFYNWKKRTVHPILPFQRLNYICCSFNECEALWICIQLLNSLHIVLLCILQLFTLVLYMCTLLKRTKLFICLGAANPISPDFSKREREYGDTTNGMYLVHCKVFLLSIMLEIQEYRVHQQCIILYYVCMYYVFYTRTLIGKHVNTCALTL